MALASKVEQTLDLPEGVSATIEKGTITVKGPEGEVSRTLPPRVITITTESNEIKLAPSKQETRREKRMINTYRAHLRNMIKGVQEPYTYKLKVCSSHFPMKVQSQGDKLVVSNFIGEKTAREIRIDQEVECAVEGEDVILTSPSKEKAGQVAGRIENAMKRAGFDRRVFQDGIYITEKAGRSLK